MGETILVLGGARSGKSRLAERLAAEVGGPVAYIATAALNPADPEMTARIERHRAERSRSWTTWEVPRLVPEILPTLAARAGAVIVDCLTLWITNLMLGLGGGPELDDDAILDQVDRAAASSRGEARVVWVSNEVGSGVVPPNPLARRFADLQGLANQRLAAACDQVHLCVAGLSIRLK
jgi:adenosylcobinamide kinase / adenosylcobinamide-phosphate guanylyltransferase